MKRAFLQFVKLTGRYAVLVIFAFAALVFAGWLLLLDVSVLWFLLLSFVAIPLASGAIALLVGMLFSGVPTAPGTGVDRNDAPLLWSAIDEIFGAVHARDLRLFLTPDVDASIMVSRRHLGFFGEVIDLVLGVALLKVCDERDVKAVIRHEFAHLQHRDTNGARNLAEFDRTFDALFDFAPPGETILGSLTAVAFGSLQSLLEADEAKLSREAELAADHAASIHDRPAELASALYRMTSSSRFLTKTIYEPLGGEILGSTKAPKSPLERILGLPDPICDAETFHRCWAESLTEVPDPLASHPQPTQRLDALGMSQGWRTEPAEVPALAKFIPAGLLDRARKEFEEMWRGNLEHLYE